MGWPAAEIEVDEDLIRSLLREQHPDLARLPLEDTGAGWDNLLWRLGDELLVRLPRRATAAALTVNEQRWLPELARRLPCPCRRLDGSVDRAAATRGRGRSFPGCRAARPTAAGLIGHRSTPPCAWAISSKPCTGRRRPRPRPTPGGAWPWPSARRTFEERVSALAEEIDGPATRRVWDRALAVAPWTGPPLWLHGDLHPANILVAQGTVSAVLDFGDLCAGDPATDLAGAWMLLPSEAMSHFHAAYGGVDDALEMRSLGWAVLFGLMLLGIGLDDRPTYETVGRATLARVMARSEDIGG